jgi:hypothetical protein
MFCALVGEFPARAGQRTPAQINKVARELGRWGGLSIHEQFSGLTDLAFVCGFTVIAPFRKVSYEVGRPFD